MTFHTTVGGGDGVGASQIARSWSMVGRRKPRLVSSKRTLQGGTVNDLSSIVPKSGLNSSADETLCGETSEL